jgi:hypothetical protein
VTRIDVATGEILQGVDLLQIYGDKTFFVDLNGGLKLAPLIGTQILEFLAAEDSDLLLYEDNDKIKLEGAA